MTTQFFGYGMKENSAAEAVLSRLAQAINPLDEAETLLLTLSPKDYSLQILAIAERLIELDAIDMLERHAKTIDDAFSTQRWARRDWENYLERGSALMAFKRRREAALPARDDLIRVA